jgi:hypothetical protein
VIISGRDDKNVAVVLDLMQAKLIVECLRQLTQADLVRAAENTHKDGFELLANDALYAAGSFVSIVGYVTDKIQSLQGQVIPVKPIDGTMGEVTPEEGGGEIIKPTIH